LNGYWWVDLLITIIYILELLVQLFIKWWRPFFQDGWCLLDLVCVSMSIIGILTDSSVQVVRLVRILRVIRIFRHSSSLQRIISAIVQCLAPLMQTLMLIMVVNAIYSVISTQLYGSLCPGMFGTFSTSALTLVQVGTGDGWMTDVVRPLQSFARNGELAGEGSECASVWSTAQSEELVAGYQALTAIFFTSYVVLVYVILLNVTISVLLEGFLSAIYDYEKEDERAKGVKEYQKLAQPLDALLHLFSGFQSAENLSSMIHRFFRMLDVDASNAITFDEFKEGLESLVLEPKISVSIDDWSHFISHSNSSTEIINIHEFDLCMRMELRNYAHRVVAHQMNEAKRYNKDTSTDYLAFKILMNDLSQLSQRLDRLPTTGVLQPGGVPLTGGDSESKKAADHSGIERELADLRSTIADQREHLIAQQATLQVLIPTDKLTNYHTSHCGILLFRELVSLKKHSC